MKGKIRRASVWGKFYRFSTYNKQRPPICTPINIFCTVATLLIKIRTHINLKVKYPNIS